MQHGMTNNERATALTNGNAMTPSELVRYEGEH